MNIGNLDKICRDEAAFSQLFVKELGLQENVKKLQTAICKDLASINLTRLRESLPGLDLMTQSVIIFLDI